jgi:hypothetical protein
MINGLGVSQFIIQVNTFTLVVRIRESSLGISQQGRSIRRLITLMDNLLVVLPVTMIDLLSLLVLLVVITHSESGIVDDFSHINKICPHT